MYFKKIGLTLLAVGCMTFCFSQKVKLRDFTVKTTHYSLPTIGLPLDINTYHVDVTANENGLKSLGWTSSEIAKQTKIPGYEKLNGAGAKVIVTLDGPSGNPQKLITKDKKNKEGKTWKEYHYSVTGNGSYKLKILDDKGNVLHDSAQPYSKTNTTSSYRSVKDLKKNYDSSKFYISLRKEILKDMLKGINAELSSKFGLVERTSKVDFQGVKGDKHPDAKKINAKKATVEEAFATMTLGDLSKYNETIKPVIDFWTEMEPKYSGSDKHQKKLKYACQINLARAYFWGEDFENAKKYATMVEKGDYRERNGKKLLKDIEDVEEKMNKTGRETRHLNIEISEEDKKKSEEAAKAKEEAIASGDIRAYHNFASMLGVEGDSKIVSGKVFNRGGAQLDGYFVFESNTNIPDFREPVKLRFGYDHEGEIKRRYMEYEQIDSLIIDGKLYHIDDAVIGVGITKVKLENAIIELIQPYEKTNLVMIHPPFKWHKAPFGERTELNPELIVYHKAKKEYMRPDGLSGFTKAMEKIVDNCPTASDYLATVKAERKNKSVLKRASGFDNTNEIKKSLELYDGCK